MEFGILGPLRIVEGAESLPIGGPTRRALLAYLLLHANRAVPSDELIEAIWEDEPPETAPSSLQNHVSRLRRALGADRLLTRGRAYELRVEPGELDLEVAESLVHEAERLGPAARAPKLREALALWRGRAFAELDSFAFARLEALRLEERRLDLLEECLAAELAGGRADGVVSELRSLVAEHPLRERLRGQLMVALYTHGRQAEALEVYRIGREMLVEEAGLEPGPALRELERAILRQELGVPAPAEATGEPARRWRTGWKGQLLAGLLIAALALATGLVVRRDPGPALAGMPANSLGVIDPGSNRIVAAISVGQRPVSVAAGDRAVWVANAADGTVSRVDPDTRRLVKNVRARTDHGAVRAGPLGVWAVGRSGHSVSYQAVLSRIDPDLVTVIGGGRFPAVSTRYDETFVIGEGFGSVWATAGWQVLRLDGRAKVQATVAGFTSARGLAIGEDGVWVGDIAQPANGASTVSRIDPRTNAVAARIPVAAEVAAVAVGAGAVWVASDNGILTRIDPEANVATTTIDLGGALSDVAVGEGAVWVANTGARNVARIDPKTTDVVARIRTGAAPDAIAVGDDAVWVTAY